MIIGASLTAFLLLWWTIFIAGATIIMFQSLLAKEFPFT